LFGATRARLAVEEHGAGRQLLRFRLTPRAWVGSLAGIGLSALSVGAGLDAAWVACVVLGAAALTVLGLAAWSAGGAAAALAETVERLSEGGADAAEERVESPESPEQAWLPSVRRLPPLEHARLSPAIEARLANAEVLDDDGGPRGAPGTRRGSR
jgi:hypothetical protein